MAQLFTLFEHAAGYSLFRVSEFEEISMALPQVKASVNDIGKFRSIVQLVAFKPFQTGQDALENINSISEGILHPDLQLFLETNVPKSKKKKQPIVLGVGDTKLSAAINEATGITCQHSGVVPEIIRGIRVHFQNLVSGFKGGSAPKAQLGLGHNYSRAKVKFNVNRVDNMIIQSISLLDQLDKDINLFAMRVREWYSYHFPELFKIVPENGLYAEVVGLIKDRKTMTEETVEKLRELLKDDAKTDHILEVARSSMGMDISPIDLINIECFATRVSSLITYRKELMEYLKSRMHNVAPSLASLIGETVGARLISHAGSLTNLAKYPASTVQILGAEKALFRALKTRGNTPKYGLIFHSTFIGKAAKQNKGRISRFLANKCSLASRIDCFAEIPTEVFGQKLKQQVEDRLKFYETGIKPSKNIDVMSEAADEVAVLQEKLLKKQRKREKKEKKRKLLEALGNSTLDSSAFENSTMEMQDDSLAVADLPNGLPAKKKKKKKNKEENDQSVLDGTCEENGLLDQTMDDDAKPKKRKKHSHDADILNEDNDVFDPDTDEQPKKKKKNKGDDEPESATTVSPIKKKKKKKQSVEE